MAEMTIGELEARIADYFRAKDCDVEQVGLECFLSLYDEGPAISLTGLAMALAGPACECDNPAVETCPRHQR